MGSERLTMAGCDIDLFQDGEGEPLLFLHPAGGFRREDPFVARLAERRRLICPSHPGFGRSSLPDWIDSVDDISIIYLELLDRLGLDRVDVVGCSIGGWIAAEMMTKAPERFRRAVLVAPVGVKVGPADSLDIPDIFVMPPADVGKLLFHDPQRHAPNPAAMSDEELTFMVRNRETLALLVWEPYMHNPKLPHRLHRVRAPTLFLRGESDGLVRAQYMEAYASLVPGARTQVIREAGHAPQIEQPEAFVAAVLGFMGEADSAA